MRPLLYRITATAGVLCLAGGIVATTWGATSARSSIEVERGRADVAVAVVEAGLEHVLRPGSTVTSIVRVSNPGTARWRELRLGVGLRGAGQGVRPDGAHVIVERCAGRWTVDRELEPRCRGERRRVATAPAGTIARVRIHDGDSLRPGGSEAVLVVTALPLTAGNAHQGRAHALDVSVVAH